MADSYKLEFVQHLIVAVLLTKEAGYLPQNKATTKGDRLPLSLQYLFWRNISCFFRKILGESYYIITSDESAGFGGRSRVVN